jgi:cardiolipin synthase
LPSLESQFKLKIPNLSTAGDRRLFQLDQDIEINIFFSGDDYFRNVLSAINEATQSIFVESYIFDYDPVGQAVLKALSKKRAEGLDVRLLVDGIGSYNWIKEIQKECQRSDIALRVFHPIPWQAHLLAKLTWRNILRLLRLFRFINKRNHRKVFLIDEKILFTGSMNVSQVHSARYLGSQAWRDTGLAFQPLDQNELRPLHSALEKTWKSSRFPNLKQAHWAKVFQRHYLPVSLQRVRLNSNWRWRWQLTRDLLKRIHKAQRRVLITNAYFLPRRSLLRAIRRAAKRGVYVGLCLPEKSDIWFLREATRSLYADLLNSGVHIFEYRPRILHAKSLIIDDWAIIGSNNLNHRSLLHDLELDVAIGIKSDESNLVEQLVHQWRDDLKSSVKISISKLGKRSRLRHLFGKIIYWFRYWL